jgi:RNA chaperone Hfq
MGRLRRFDKFALVLEVDGHEEMIYKHAIASIRAETLPPTS